MSEFQVEMRKGEKVGIHKRADTTIWVQKWSKSRYNSAERTTNPTNQRAMATVCKHPRVRVVSRHDDTEFVECLECGEIFDAEEFRDMEIEENVEQEERPDEAD